MNWEKKQQSIAEMAQEIRNTQDVSYLSVWQTTLILLFVLELN